MGVLFGYGRVGRRPGPVDCAADYGEQVHLVRFSARTKRPGEPRCRVREGASAFGPSGEESRLAARAARVCQAATDGQEKEPNQPSRSEERPPAASEQGGPQA